jgi:hypothetical protein
MRALAARRPAIAVVAVSILAACSALRDSRVRRESSGIRQVQAAAIAATAAIG